MFKERLFVSIEMIFAGSLLFLRKEMIYLDDIELLLHEKIIFDQFMERHFDRILYGHDLRYAPARHLVKGVSYGDENLLRAGLRPKNLGQVKEKRSGGYRPGRN